MNTPETAVVLTFDVLQDVIASGADPIGPLGSGAAWTINTYGTPTQRAQLQRQEMAAAREHGAVPSRRTAGAGKAAATDTFGMHALDRAIAESFGLEEK